MDSVEVGQLFCSIPYTNSYYLKSLATLLAKRLAKSSTILRNFQFIQPKVLARTPLIIPTQINSQTRVY